MSTDPTTNTPLDTGPYESLDNLCTPEQKESWLKNLRAACDAAETARTDITTSKRVAVKAQETISAHRETIRELVDHHVSNTPKAIDSATVEGVIAAETVRVEASPTHRAAETMLQTLYKSGNGVEILNGVYSLLGKEPSLGLGQIQISTADELLRTREIDWKTNQPTWRSEGIRDYFTSSGWIKAVNKEVEHRKDDIQRKALLDTHELLTADGLSTSERYKQLSQQVASSKREINGLRSRVINETRFHHPRDEVAGLLLDPKSNIELLVKELDGNYKFYGRSPGKTHEHRIAFAIGKHFAGHEIIGQAQVEVILETKRALRADNGKLSHDDIERFAKAAGNNWTEVSKHLPPELVNSVQTALDWRAKALR